jgi:hypothetical protein
LKQELEGFIHCSLCFLKREIENILHLFIAIDKPVRGGLFNFLQCGFKRFALQLQGQFFILAMARDGQKHLEANQRECHKKHTDAHNLPDI